MTTAKHRAETQNFTAERNATNDARQAGAVAAGLLPELMQAVLERAADLAMAGRLAESRAFVVKHFSK